MPTYTSEHTRLRMSEHNEAASTSTPSTVHIPLSGGGYEPINSLDPHDAAYDLDHEAIQKSLLQFCSAESWNNSSRSAFMPRPILVSSEHQRQWKELNNALVSAITNIVERWWTDSVSGFSECMPLEPVEEDLFRVGYFPYLML